MYVRPTDTKAVQPSAFAALFYLTLFTILIWTNNLDTMTVDSKQMFMFTSPIPSIVHDTANSKKLGGDLRMSICVDLKGIGGLTGK